MVRLGTTFVIGLGVLAAGCSIVANLGDPRELEPPGGGTPDADGDDGGRGVALQAQSLAVGGTHACAVVSAGALSPQNGTMRCWGQNNAGQLGNDPQEVGSSSTTPVEVSGVGTAEQVGAASLTLATSYSCTITTDGFLMCWGDVPSGTGVAREQATPSVASYEPSYMDFGLARLEAVGTASVTDEGGCCTLTTDRSLLCWGADLAPPTPDGGVTQVDGGVILGDLFDSVAVGRTHACGLAATASSAEEDVECWGGNLHGQTGLPFSDLVSHPNHLGLGAKGRLRAVATGGDESCALSESPGVLYCWGANDFGQLGPAGTPGTDSPVPLPVTFAESDGGPAGAPIGVAVGDGHACAVLFGAHVYCWGDNSSSQLGVGPNGPSSSATPLIVQKAAGHNLTDVESIAAGGQTTCVTLRDDPHVWCWGANDYGQAGQPGGGTVAYATPVTW
jgi:serine/threonine-protein kinase